MSATSIEVQSPAHLLRCLSLDLEISRDDESLLSAAAYRPDSGKSLSMSGRPRGRSLEQFDRLAENASFLLGHNIINFDLPRLKALNPHLQLLNLPVVDTLRLNPLAFPSRPYHRLVKHYKDGGLVRSQFNDPLLDSRLAVEAFANQLKKLKESPPDLLTAWHWLTSRENGTGFDLVFSNVRGAEKPTIKQARDAIARTISGHGCREYVRTVVNNTHKQRWPLAYVLAWLSVPGTNSVVPPWVLLEFPGRQQDGQTAFAIARASILIAGGVGSATIQLGSSSGGSVFVDFEQSPRTVMVLLSRRRLFRRPCWGRTCLRYCPPAPASRCAIRCLLYRATTRREL